jgi:catechol 2,3-dioxygenase-like lactoylglutathione lyase family enzyme
VRQLHEVLPWVEAGQPVGSLDEAVVHLGDLERRYVMNWTLEVVVVPVSDVDRAKAFYAEQLGFNVDHDTRISDEGRVIQLTPPGSGCSIVVGKGVVPDMPPGSLKGLQLVVNDIHAARAQLVERGVEVSEVQVMGENPSPTGDALDNVGFVFFSDPDGNGWAVQQISARG